MAYNETVRAHGSINHAARDSVWPHEFFPFVLFLLSCSSLFGGRQLHCQRYKTRLQQALLCRNIKMWMHTSILGSPPRAGSVSTMRSHVRRFRTPKVVAFTLCRSTTSVWFQVCHKDFVSSAVLIAHLKHLQKTVEREKKAIFTCFSHCEKIKTLAAQSVNKTQLWGLVCHQPVVHTRRKRDLNLMHQMQY